MKVCGIIAEYNPFHKGHLFHMEEAKKRSGADYCVVVMSGYYVQRGEPAVFDPWLRARMALSSGADLVLLMPSPFSSASAREFAGFGIRLLSSLGVVGSLAFGCEYDRLSDLTLLSGILREASGDPSFYEQIRREMSRGETFPKARELALTARLSGEMSPEDVHARLSSPNTLLALEYMLAAKRSGWNPEYIPIPRDGSSSHSSGELSGDGFSSARALRGVLKSSPGDAAELLRSFVPEAILSLYREDPPVFADDFSLLLNRRILDGGYEGIADMSPEMASRLKKTAFPPVSFQNRAEALKTRDVTYTRACRALLHLLLGFTSEEMNSFRSPEALYGRILGFRKDASPLLSEIKKRASVPLLSKAANAPKLLPEPAFLLFKKDLAAAHLYETVKAEKGGSFCHELTRSPLVL